VRNVIGDTPLVAIGGITAENADEVLAAGADSVAIIKALLADPLAIISNTSKLLKSLKSGLLR
jgi:thiamine-phosphate pyrophosphorylase